MGVAGVPAIVPMTTDAAQAAAVFGGGKSPEMAGDWPAGGIFDLAQLGHLFELAGVEFLPELRRRPGLIADANLAALVEALHAAETIHAPGDVLRGQLNLF